jgi:hypothetical protein
MAATIATGMTTEGTIRLDMIATPLMAGAQGLSVGICQESNRSSIGSDYCGFSKAFGASALELGPPPVSA